MTLSYSTARFALEIERPILNGTLWFMGVKHTFLGALIDAHKTRGGRPVEQKI
jgi:hypothetical protein